MMMMLTCYRSIVVFIQFGVIVLTSMISCCSRPRRLHMVSSGSGTTVTSESEWLGLLKCSATQGFSC